MSTHKIRLAYLVTHPIQYQAPLLKLIAQDPDIELTVFFESDYSTKNFVDTGFNRMIEWDVPLLEGYHYEFLPVIGKNQVGAFWQPWVYGLAKRLKQGQFDALWIHGYMRWSHWLAILNAKRLGIKVLIRDEASLISTPRGQLKKLAKSLFFKGLKATVDSFLCIGRLNQDYYKHYNISENHLFSVPYAVDNQFFQQQAQQAHPQRETLRASLHLDPQRPIILYASKMIARKRAEDLLEAYRQLSPDGQTEPHPYLLLIGDGETRPILEQQVQQLGWQSIYLLGFINQTELPAYFDLCDVFVLPSTYEPWGLVVNEVMNAGKAVIVSNQVCCGQDLIHEGQNGYTFKAGDTTDLARVLRLALQNPQHTDYLGQNSLRIIQQWSFKEDITGLRQALGLAT